MQFVIDFIALFIGPNISYFETRIKEHKKKLHKVI